MTYSALDQERVRARVLTAWEALVADHGYGGVTVADVAKRAGLSRSSLYRYFPTKESLYLAHLEQLVAAVVDSLRTEVRIGDDAPTRLRRLLVVEMRHLSRLPKIALDDVPESLSREGHRRLLACFEPLRRLVREILEEGREDGTFAALDVDQAMPVVFACIDVVREHLSGRLVDRDQIADEVADFVLRGLGAPTVHRSAGGTAPKRTVSRSAARR